MENLKFLVLSGICVLFISLLFVPSSLSNCTLTVECQWVKLMCAFFTGVDICVRHHMAPISELDQAGLEMVMSYELYGTIVPFLRTETFDKNFIRNVIRRKSYHYHPRLTVATDDQNQVFYSQPKPRDRSHGSRDPNDRDRSRDHWHHAESRLLRVLNKTGQLETVKYINISNSPCMECARELMTAFEGRQDKPTINFVWVYGKSLLTLSDSDEEMANKRQDDREKKWNKQQDVNYMNAIMSLKALVQAGFKIGLWDWVSFSKFLKDNAPWPTTYYRGVLQDGLDRYSKQLNERDAITQDDIRVVKSHDISPLGLNEAGDGDGYSEEHNYEENQENEETVEENQENEETAEENQGGHGILSFLSLIAVLSETLNHIQQNPFLYMTAWFYYTRVFFAALMGWMIAFTFQRWTQ